MCNRSLFFLVQHLKKSCCTLKYFWIFSCTCDGGANFLLVRRPPPKGETTCWKRRRVFCCCALKTQRKKEKRKGEPRPQLFPLSSYLTDKQNPLVRRRRLRRFSPLFSAQAGNTISSNYYHLVFLSSIFPPPHLVFFFFDYQRGSLSAQLTQTLFCLANSLFSLKKTDHLLLTQFNLLSMAI